MFYGGANMQQIDTRIEVLRQFWNERRIDQPRSDEDLVEFFIDEVSK